MHRSFVLPRLLSVFLSLLALSPLSGWAGETSGHLLIEGVERSYVVHAMPTDALHTRTRWPLVLAFHGAGGDTASFMQLGHLNTAADKLGFIAVYPQGIGGVWSDGRLPHLGRPDDLAFVDALVRKLMAELPIDSSRIYATGFSNGAMFTLRLACERAHLFAAIATVAGNLSSALSHTCQVPKPLPLLLINGDEDRIVAFGGKSDGPHFKALSGLLSSQETVAFWETANHCDKSLPPVTQRAPCPGDMQIRHEIYSSCPTTGRLERVVIEGGGHTWPGGIQYLPESAVGKTCGAYDASTEILRFFLRFPSRTEKP